MKNKKLKLIIPSLVLTSILITTISSCYSVPKKEYEPIIINEEKKKKIKYDSLEFELFNFDDFETRSRFNKERYKIQIKKSKTYELFEYLQEENLEFTPNYSFNPQITKDQWEEYKMKMSDIVKIYWKEWSILNHLQTESLPIIRNKTTEEIIHSNTPINIKENSLYHFIKENGSLLNDSINRKIHYKNFVNETQFKKELGNINFDSIDLYQSQVKVYIDIFEWDEKFNKIIRDFFAVYNAFEGLYKITKNLELKEEIRSRQVDFVIENQHIIEVLFETIYWKNDYLKKLFIDQNNDKIDKSNETFIKDYKLFDFYIKLQDKNNIKKIAEDIQKYFDFRDKPFFDPNLIKTIDYENNVEKRPKNNEENGIMFLNSYIDPITPILLNQELLVGYGIFLKKENIINPTHHLFNNDFFQKPVRILKNRNKRQILYKQKELTEYYGFNDRDILKHYYKLDNQIKELDKTINDFIKEEFELKFNDEYRYNKHKLERPYYLFDFGDLNSFIVDFWKLFYELVDNDIVYIRKGNNKWTFREEYRSKSNKKGTYFSYDENN